ncbi:LppM family (lipo)protein [Ruania alba]|uniref:LppM domain-containing protein n=1 Tax=Ruania alba TaxID=648782 RepID=A0A1H5KHE4_9MICO|nr:hypothetical protein [Ruania alba]SEE64110.1 hypothetical protein SAMN04488554_2261 [Ruania alba]
MKRILTALVAILGLTLLAGCLRVEGEVTISETDTLSGEVTVAVERAWMIEQGQDPESLVDGIEEDLAAAPDEGVTGQRYDDGEYTGITLTLTRTPLDRVASATGNALTITRDGDEYVVTGDFSELNATEDAAPWSVDLTVTFPNGVTAHDGDLSGSSVTWHLSSDDPALRATGPVPGAGEGLNVPWIPVIGVLVLLSGVAFGWFSWRKRRR